jgi:phosphohistidine phosphatase
MKTIILTRHAKSDWSHLLQKDYDRELNNRGLCDAPMMGLRLAKRTQKVDLILASTARRAAQTALLIADSIQYKAEKIHWFDQLYHAQPSVIQDVILETDDQYDTALIVCHNNGLTDFANSLAGTVTENLPTCGMMAFTVETDSWSTFAMAKKTLLFYDYPKNIG